MKLTDFNRQDVEAIGRILFFIGILLFAIGCVLLAFIFVVAYPIIGLITFIIIGAASLIGSYLIDRELFQ